MKVFVYKPSNEFVGKFNISSLDELKSKLVQFSKITEVNDYDYLQCNNQNWTVLRENDELTLKEGIIKRKKKELINSTAQRSQQSKHPDKNFITEKQAASTLKTVRERTQYSWARFSITLAAVMTIIIGLIAGGMMLNSKSLFGIVVILVSLVGALVTRQFSLLLVDIADHLNCQAARKQLEE